MSSSASRRATKWHPPPPPAPKILQLPRRIRPRRAAPGPAGPARDLRALFSEEEKGTSNSSAGRAFEERENRWRAEAEMLRAECDFLRAERDSALRKLEKTRERKKIDGSDGIEKKMGKLKVRSSREVDEEKETREIEESSSSSAKKHKQNEINVEMLKRKMEGLSKGMMERMEEYGSFFISAKSRSSYSRKNQSQSQNQNQTIGTEQAVAEMANQRQVKAAGVMGHKCCCKCKEIVGRVAAEVKAESEQWTEMQEMLDQVRLEMEGLKSSRDIWQSRAVTSELNLRSLYSRMLEWRRKARAAEGEAAELQRHIFQLEKSSRAESVSPSQNANSSDESWNPMRLPRIKCQQAKKRSPEYYSLAAKEKHVLVCRLTSPTTTSSPKSNFRSRRSPLREIGNFSAALTSG